MSLAGACNDNVTVAQCWVSHTLIPWAVSAEQVASMVAGKATGMSSDRDLSEQKTDKVLNQTLASGRVGGGTRADQGRGQMVGLHREPWFVRLQLPPPLASIACLPSKSLLRRPARPCPGLQTQHPDAAFGPGLVESSVAAPGLLHVPGCQHATWATWKNQQLFLASRRRHFRLSSKIPWAALGCLPPLKLVDPRFITGLCG